MFLFSFKQVPNAENYFEKLFPKIAALALKLPEQVKKVSADVAQIILLTHECLEISEHVKNPTTM